MDPQGNKTTNKQRRTDNPQKRQSAPRDDRFENQSKQSYRKRPPTNEVDPVGLQLGKNRNHKISTGLGKLFNVQENKSRRQHYAKSGHLNPRAEAFVRPDAGVTLLQGDGKGHYRDNTRAEVESALDRMVAAELQPGVHEGVQFVSNDEILPMPTGCINIPSTISQATVARTGPDGFIWDPTPANLGAYDYVVILQMSSATAYNGPGGTSPLGTTYLSTTTRLGGFAVGQIEAAHEEEPLFRRDIFFNSNIAYSMTEKYSSQFTGFSEGGMVWGDETQFNMLIPEANRIEQCFQGFCTLGQFPGGDVGQGLSLKQLINNSDVMDQRYNPWLRTSIQNRNIPTFSMMTEPNVRLDLEVAPLQTEIVNWLIIQRGAMSIIDGSNAIYSLAMDVSANILFWQRMSDPVANQIFKSADVDDRELGVESSILPHMTDGINPNDFILTPSETVSRVGQSVSHAVEKARKQIKKRGTKGTIKRFFKKALKTAGKGIKKWGPTVAKTALSLLLAPNPEARLPHHVEVRRDLIFLTTEVITQLEYVVGCPEMASAKEKATSFLNWLHRQPGRLVDLYDYDPDEYPNETRSLKLPNVQANPYLWYLKCNANFELQKPRIKQANCLGYLIDPDCNYQRVQELDGTKDADCPLIDSDELTQEVNSVNGQIGIDWESQYTLETRAPVFFDSINWDEQSARYDLPPDSHDLQSLVLTEFIVSVVGWAPESVDTFINTRSGCLCLQSIYVQRNTWRIGYKNRQHATDTDDASSVCTSRSRVTGNSAPQNRVRP